MSNFTAVLPDDEISRPSTEDVDVSGDYTPQQAVAPPPVYTPAALRRGPPVMQEPIPRPLPAAPVRRGSTQIIPRQAPGVDAYKAEVDQQRARDQFDRKNEVYQNAYLREQIRQQKAAALEQRNAAKQTLKENNAVAEARAQGAGIATHKDEFGRVEPSFNPMTGGVETKQLNTGARWDQAGREYEIKRGADGAFTMVYKDKQADIGPDKDNPQDPNIYRQNKGQPWQGYDPKVGIFSSDAKVAKASQDHLLKGRLKDLKEKIDIEKSLMPLQDEVLTDADRRKLREADEGGLPLLGTHSAEKLDRTREYMTREKKVHDMQAELAQIKDFTPDQYGEHLRGKVTPEERMAIQSKDLQDKLAYHGEVEKELTAKQQELEDQRKALIARRSMPMNKMTDLPIFERDKQSWLVQTQMWQARKADFDKELAETQKQAAASIPKVDTKDKPVSQDAVSFLSKDPHGLAEEAVSLNDATKQFTADRQAFEQEAEARKAKISTNSESIAFDNWHNQNRAMIQKRAIALQNRAETVNKAGERSQVLHEDAMVQKLTESPFHRDIAPVVRDIQQGLRRDSAGLPEDEKQKLAELAQKKVTEAVAVGDQKQKDLFNLIEAHGHARNIASRLQPEPDDEPWQLQMKQRAVDFDENNRKAKLKPAGEMTPAEKEAEAMRGKKAEDTYPTILPSDVKKWARLTGVPEETVKNTVDDYQKGSFVGEYADAVSHKLSNGSYVINPVSMWDSDKTASESGSKEKEDKQAFDMSLYKARNDPGNQAGVMRAMEKSFPDAWPNYVKAHSDKPMAEVITDFRKQEGLDGNKFARLLNPFVWGSWAGTREKLWQAVQTAGSGVDAGIMGLAQMATTTGKFNVGMFGYVPEFVTKAVAEAAKPMHKAYEGEASELAGMNSAAADFTKMAAEMLPYMVFGGGIGMGARAAGIGEEVAAAKAIPEFSRVLKMGEAAASAGANTAKEYAAAMVDFGMKPNMAAIAGKHFETLIATGNSAPLMKSIMAGIDIPIVHKVSSFATMAAMTAGGTMNDATKAYTDEGMQQMLAGRDITKMSPDELESIKARAEIYGATHGRNVAMLAGVLGGMVAVAFPKGMESITKSMMGLPKEAVNMSIADFVAKSGGEKTIMDVWRSGATKEGVKAFLKMSSTTGKIMSSHMLDQGAEMILFTASQEMLAKLTYKPNTTLGEILHSAIESAGMGALMGVYPGMKEAFGKGRALDKARGKAGGSGDTGAKGGIEPTEPPVAPQTPEEVKSAVDELDKFHAGISTEAIMEGRKGHGGEMPDLAGIDNEIAAKRKAVEMAPEGEAKDTAMQDLHDTLLARSDALNQMAGVVTDGDPAEAAKEIQAARDANGGQSPDADLVEAAVAMQTHGWDGINTNQQELLKTARGEHGSAVTEEGGTPVLQQGFLDNVNQRFPQSARLLPTSELAQRAIHGQETAAKPASEAPKPKAEAPKPAEAPKAPVEHPEDVKAAISSAEDGGKAPLNEKAQAQVAEALGHVREAMKRFAPAFGGKQPTFTMKKKGTAGFVLENGELVVSVPDILRAVDNLKQGVSPKKWASLTMREEGIHSLVEGFAATPEGKALFENITKHLSDDPQWQKVMKQLYPAADGENVAHEFLASLIAGKLQVKKGKWYIDGEEIRQEELSDMSTPKGRAFVEAIKDALKAIQEYLKGLLTGTNTEFDADVQKMVDTVTKTIEGLDDIEAPKKAEEAPKNDRQATETTPKNEQSEPDKLAGDVAPAEAAKAKEGEKISPNAEQAGTPALGAMGGHEGTSASPHVSNSDKEYTPDEALIMHSPYTGEDTTISYRGDHEGKAVVWTGKSQISVPKEWLRRKGEKRTGPTLERVAPTPNAQIPEAPVTEENEVPELPFPKGKKAMALELAGPKPTDYVRIKEWEKLLAKILINTSWRIEEMVKDSRAFDKKHKALAAKTKKNFAPIKALVAASPEHWRKAFSSIAKDNGIEDYVTMPDNSKGEETYRLASSLAERGVDLSKQSPEAAAGKDTAETPTETTTNGQQTKEQEQAQQGQVGNEQLLDEPAAGEQSPVAETPVEQTRARKKKAVDEQNAPRKKKEPKKPESNDAPPPETKSEKEQAPVTDSKGRSPERVEFLNGMAKAVSAGMKGEGMLPKSPEKPAQDSQQAPARDASRPEQMTPEEFGIKEMPPEPRKPRSVTQMFGQLGLDSPSATPEVVAAWKKSQKDYKQWQKESELMRKKSSEYFEKTNEALAKKLPIGVEAMKTRFYYEDNIPSGYTKRGDLYVYESKSIKSQELPDSRYRKADTNERRIERGDEPLEAFGSRSHESVRASAAAKLRENPSLGRELAAEYAAGRKNASDEDHFILSLDHERIAGEIARQNDILADSGGKDPSVASRAQAELDRLEHEREVNEVASVNGHGSNAGRALAARKAYLQTEYTDASVLNRIQGKMRRRLDPADPKDKAIIDKVKAEVQKRIDAVKEEQRLRDEKRKGEFTKAAEAAHVEASGEAAKEGIVPTSPEEDSFISKAKSIYAKIEAKVRSSISSLWGVKDKSIKSQQFGGIHEDVVAYATAMRAKGANSIDKIRDAFVSEFGEEAVKANLDPVIDRLWEATDEHMEATLGGMDGSASVKKQATARIKKTDEPSVIISHVMERMKVKAGEGSKISDLDAYTRKMGIQLIRSGIKDREAMFDALHEHVKEIFPDITRQETVESFSGYGRRKALTTDPDVLHAMDIAAQGRELSKIDDILVKIRSHKTSGIERKAPDAETRRLIKLAKATIREHPELYTNSAEGAGRSVEQSIRTRLLNEIEEMDKAISNGKPMLSRKGRLEYSSENKRLLEQRNAKRAEYDALFPKAPRGAMSTEQRMKAMDASLARRIEETKKQLETGNIWPERPADKAKPSSPEIKAKEELLKTLQGERDVLREADTAHRDELRLKQLQNVGKQYAKRIEAMDKSGESDRVAGKEPRAMTPAEVSMRESNKRAQRQVRELQDKLEPFIMETSIRAARQRLNTASAKVNARAEVLQQEIDRIKAAKEAGKPLTGAEIDAGRESVAELLALIARTGDPEKIRAVAEGNKAAIEDMIADSKAKLAAKETVNADTRIGEASRKVKDAEIALRKLEAQLEEASRSGPDKFGRFVARLRKANILSSPAVIYHLGGAGAIGVELSHLRTVPVVGARILGRLMPKSGLTELLNLATHAGHASWEAERAMYVGNKKAGGELTPGGLLTKATFKGVLEKFSKGLSAPDALYGGNDFMPHGGWHVPTSFHDFREMAMDSASSFHAMLKEGPRMAHFAKALTAEWAAAERVSKAEGDASIDPANNEMTREVIRVRALIQANKEIMLGDNIISDALSKLRNVGLRKYGDSPEIGKLIANLYDLMMPVQKVPENILNRVLSYATGWAAAPISLAYYAKKGLLKGMTEGKQKLTTEQAEFVVNNARNGVLGFAVLLAAWSKASAFGGIFVPSQQWDRKKAKLGYGDIDFGELLGMDKSAVLGHQLAHDPLMMMANEVAQLRKYFDHEFQKNGNISDAYLKTAGMGLFMPLQGEPVYNMFARLANPYMDFPEKISGVAADVLSNKMVEAVGAKFDKDENGEPVKREAKTFADKMKVGWGMREGVAAKQDGLSVGGMSGGFAPMPDGSAPKWVNVAVEWNRKIAEMRKAGTVPEGSKYEMFLPEKTDITLPKTPDRNQILLTPAEQKLRDEKKKSEMNKMLKDFKTTGDPLTDVQYLRKASALASQEATLVIQRQRGLK